MRFRSLSIAAVLVLVPVLYVNAQENSKRGPYETNKFFDNTFVGIGAGVNSMAVHPTMPKTWGNIGFAAEVSFGKWCTPVIGMRLGFSGIWNNSSEALEKSYIDANTPFGMAYIHGDFLWNVSNSARGYSRDRFWSVAPYLTSGLLQVSPNRNLLRRGIINNEYAAGAGLYNDIKLHEKVHLYLDIRALVAKASTFSSEAKKVIVIPSATAGLAFQIGKTYFQRHSEFLPIPLPSPVEPAMRELEMKLKALEDENVALKEKLSSLEKERDSYKGMVTGGLTYLYNNGTFTEVDIKSGTSVSVYFDRGSSVISDRERAHLEYFAKGIPSGSRLFVNGYADKQTGSTARNQKLSEQRVAAVKSFLLNAGIPDTNIESEAHGASVQPFDSAEKNRVVTVEIK